MRNDILKFNDLENKTNTSRIIDLRPFFDEEKEAKEEGENENIQILNNMNIVSPAIRAEKKRETDIKYEKEERQERKPFKYIFSKICLLAFKKILVFFIEFYQNLEQKMNPFEKKYDEKQLFYISMSIPENIKTEKDLLILCPFLSRSIRFKILNMKKNTLKTYEEVFNKK
jgi:hypothetical protein